MTVDREPPPELPGPADGPRGAVAISQPSVRRGAIDPKLLELLACPIAKGPLAWIPERNELVSKAARLAYPVRDGIPIMLPSEARQLAENEF